jgi:hypothetical protein
MTLFSCASFQDPVADHFLVNVEPNVIHTLHGGASLVESESALPLSSPLLHQALLHDLFIQTLLALAGLGSAYGVGADAAEHTGGAA